MTERARLPSRVVLDTSTLISAMLREGSIPWQALTCAMRFCEICANQETLEELRKVASRKKFDRYQALTERERFVHEIDGAVRLFAVMQADEAFAQPQCRDAKHQKFLELALMAEADVIIASDDDLIVPDPWNEVRVMRPAAFLEAMDKRA